MHKKGNSMNFNINMNASETTTLIGIIANITGDADIMSFLNKYIEEVSGDLYQGKVTITNGELNISFSCDSSLSVQAMNLVGNLIAGFKGNLMSYVHGLMALQEFTSKGGKSTINGQKAEDEPTTIWTWTDHDRSVKLKFRAADSDEEVKMLATDTVRTFKSKVAEIKRRRENPQKAENVNPQDTESHQ